MTHFNWPGFLENDIPLSEPERRIAELHLRSGTPFNVARPTGFFSVKYEYWRVMWLTRKPDGSWWARVQHIGAES